MDDLFPNKSDWLAHDVFGHKSFINQSLIFASASDNPGGKPPGLSPFNRFERDFFRKNGKGNLLQIYFLPALAECFFLPLIPLTSADWLAHDVLDINLS